MDMLIQLKSGQLSEQLFQGHSTASQEKGYGSKASSSICTVQTMDQNWEVPAPLTATHGIKLGELWRLLWASSTCIKCEFPTRSNIIGVVITKIHCQGTKNGRMA